MGLDMILYSKTCNYQMVFLLNLKMFLFAWLPNFLLSQKIYNYSKFIFKIERTDTKII